jgi:transcription termination factor Rho
MSVLDRAALQESPLADLHAIASELSIDSYRRLRKPELIDAILERQGGKAEAESESAEDEEQPARRRRGRRGGRGRGTAREQRGEAEGEAGDEDTPEAEAPLEEPEVEAAEVESDAAEAESDAAEAESDAAEVESDAAEVESDAAEGESEAAESEAAEAEDQVVEGTIELLPNGSGFVRVDPPEPSDEDVYISAAQVKRCELVSGDRVTGPRRPPRRSERFASMVRIDTINGRPAEELADSVRFEDLPAAYPDDRFRLGSDDPTVKAIEWLTPLGRGSRVTIVGAPRAGKSEALRRLAGPLSQQEGLQMFVVLVGVRPEEISEWRRDGIEPTAVVSLGSSADAQGQSAERVVDQARRLAARGAEAVVLIDSLDGMQPHVARRLLAAARNIADGGSLTVVATASDPLGGETTVIALDVALASTGRFPALDLAASGTVRPELLVGDAGAEAIQRARAEALDA